MHILLKIKYVQLSIVHAIQADQSISDQEKALLNERLRVLQDLAREEINKLVELGETVDVLKKNIADTLTAEQQLRTAFQQQAANFPAGKTDSNSIAALDAMLSATAEQVWKENPNYLTVEEIATQYAALAPQAFVEEKARRDAPEKIDQLFSFLVEESVVASQENESIEDENEFSNQYEALQKQLEKQKRHSNNAYAQSEEQFIEYYVQHAEKAEKAEKAKEAKEAKEAAKVKKAQAEKLDRYFRRKQPRVVAPNATAKYFDTLGKMVETLRLKAEEKEGFARTASNLDGGIHDHKAEIVIAADLASVIAIAGAAGNIGVNLAQYSTSTSESSALKAMNHVFGPIVIGTTSTLSILALISENLAAFGSLTAPLGIVFGSVASVVVDMVNLYKLDTEINSLLQEYEAKIAAAATEEERNSLEKERALFLQHLYDERTEVLADVIENVGVSLFAAGVAFQMHGYTSAMGAAFMSPAAAVAAPIVMGILAVDALLKQLPEIHRLIYQSFQFLCRMAFKEPELHWGCRLLAAVVGIIFVAPALALTSILRPLADMYQNPLLYLVELSKANSCLKVPALMLAVPLAVVLSIFKISAAVIKSSLAVIPSVLVFLLQSARQMLGKEYAISPSEQLKKALLSQAYQGYVGIKAAQQAYEKPFAAKLTPWAWFEKEKVLLDQQENAELAGFVVKEDAGASKINAVEAYLEWSSWQLEEYIHAKEKVGKTKENDNKLAIAQEIKDFLEEKNPLLAIHSKIIFNKEKRSDYHRTAIKSSRLVEITHKIENALILQLEHEQVDQLLAYKIAKIQGKEKEEPSVEETDSENLENHFAAAVKSNKQQGKSFRDAKKLAALQMVKQTLATIKELDDEKKIVHYATLIQWIDKQKSRAEISSSKYGTSETATLLNYAQRYCEVQRAVLLQQYPQYNPEASSSCETLTTPSFESSSNRSSSFVGSLGEKDMSLTGAKVNSVSSLKNH